MGYTTVNLGLTLTIPTSGTRNWGQQVLTGTWNRISAHDHSGGGLGQQIDTTGIADDSITSAKIAPNIALTQAALVTVTGLNQSVTLDFNNGNIQILDLQGATGTLTVTLSNAQAGADYKIFCINPASALTFVWPVSVKWPQAQKPIWTESLGAVDGVSLYYTGSVFYSDWQLNFS